MGGYAGTQRHRSSAVPLAWLYAALIVYASLYPFTGWGRPADPVFAFLGYGWPRWWTWFDLVANGAGYAPFGFLVYVALLRGGRSSGRSAVVALVLGALLSFSLETAQVFLPRRVASNVDLALNVAGTLLGVAVGTLLQARGGIARWERVRERWLVPRSAGGAALLVLWPVALLFPTAVPFGIGHVLGRIAAGLEAFLADSTLQAWVATRTGGGATALASPPVLARGAELGIVVLGLLAPCLVAYTIARPGWRRPALAAGGVLAGCTAITLSTALNFGPQHALAWSTPVALQGVLIALGCAVALGLLPGRLSAALGLVVVTMLVMLVAQAPDDPYFVESVHGWQQGEFIHFYGAAQWVGWAWPYAALVYLVARVSTRDGGGPARGWAGGRP